MPPDTTESQEMIAEVRSRTEAGYRWLIEHVGPKVKGLLMHKFGRHRGESIEDAIVEAAETLWLRDEAFDPTRGSLVSWLYACAANKCVDQYRAERARPLIDSIGGQVLSEMYGKESPDDSASERTARLLADLRECIEHLNPRQQEIIYATLSGFDGTDAELGERLGTSDNVVRVTRVRAHQKLGELMRGLHDRE